jgi:hypothetical protein
VQSVEKSQMLAAIDGAFPIPPVAKAQSNPTWEIRKQTPTPAKPMTRALRIISSGLRGDFESEGFSSIPKHASMCIHTRPSLSLRSSRGLGRDLPAFVADTMDRRFPLSPRRDDVIASVTSDRTRDSPTRILNRRASKEGLGSEFHL